jgi:hypothetical protein
MDAAMRPLHDQQTKERAEQERLETTLQHDQQHEREHELEPSGRTLETGEREQPAQPKEIELEIDFSFDR